MIYWNPLIDKWVLNFPSNAKPPHYCTYESLLADPQARVREILTFLSEGTLDEERFRAAMLECPIEERSSIEKFEYYDSDFFQKI